MRKAWKKVLVGMFVFAMVLSGISMMEHAENQVYAAGNEGGETEVKYYVQQYEGTEVKAYKDANIAPVPTPSEEEKKASDWIFAGWFTDITCEMALGETIEAGGTYYAKYVPAEVLSVKAQVTSGTNVETEKTDMRLVATVDDLQYKSVGFEVYYNGATTPVRIKTTTVYSRIEAAREGVEYGFSPNIFDTQSEYFVTATLKNIANANFSKSFYIRPYWETLDGTTVYGVSRYARVEDSYLNIVNIPVRLVSESTTATEVTVNVSEFSNYFTYVDAYGTSIFETIAVDGTTTPGTVSINGTSANASKVNGEIAHLRFQANGALQKKNVFKITAVNMAEGIVANDSVYNFFGIAASYSGTPDTSWFDANETEFVLTTAEELYGLASLVNAKTFGSQTIYLASNIVVNTGTPEGADGVWGTGNDDWSTVAPTHNWTPIGRQGVTTFNGTFDGQGHSIIGMYASQAYAGVGLFGQTNVGSCVKNLKVTDSYFSSNAKSGAAAICGWYANGTYENIYSDAYIKNTADHAGGLLMGNNGKTLIKNCWFDGQVQGKKYVGGITGYANGDGIEIESCLFTGTINVTGGHVGGVIGYATKSTTIKDALVTGTVTINTSTASGAIVGVTAANVTIGCTNVYTNSSKLSYSLASGSAVSGANTVTNLTGLDAYKNTQLDFENYWVIRQSATPVLKSWCESDALYAPKTDWTGSGTEKDPYVIKTPEHLYGLADSVNAGTTYEGKYFKLGANIIVNSGTASNWETEAPKYNWIPIGTGANQFEGNFNTNGSVYSVKGLYAVKSVDTTNMNYYMGMFGNVNGAKIGNLKVLNSYFSASAYIGAIAGTAANSEIYNVYSDAIVRIPVNGGSIGGGLVGHMTTAGSIANAWYDGAIIANGRFLGGIVGIAEGVQTMDDCLFTGRIECTNTNANVYTGGLIGLARKSIKISDSVVAATNIQSTKTGTFGSVLGSVSDSSSSAAFLVDYDNVYALDALGNTAKTVGREAYGGGESSGSPVEVSSLTGANAYLNTYLTFDRHEDALPESAQHDGIWVAREGKAPGLKSFVSKDDRMELVGQNMYRADTRCYNTTDTTFTIDTAEEFVGFMSLVNANTSFAGKTVQLGADITLNVGNASDWYAGKGEAKLYNSLPIGNAGKKFTGTFDGQGHTISGVYGDHPSAGQIGLFGQVADGSVVRDFKLINSYFYSGSSNGAASICGWYGGGTFDTIYSDAYVQGVGNHIAGMFAVVNAGTTIKNCWFAGTMKAGNSYSGGMLSFIASADVVIESCLNTGTLIGTSEIGGMVGRTATNTTIKNSLSVGTITSTTGSLRKGAIIGWPHSGNAVCENVYGLGTDVDLFVTKAGTATAGGTVTGTYAGVANLTGANGFLNTWLTFDRPELPTPTTGTWVAIDGGTPVLKNFVEFADGERLALTGQNMYRVDTRWFDETKAGSETIGETTYTTYTLNNAEELLGFAKLVDDKNVFADTIVYLGADIVLNNGKATDWADGKNTAELYPWNAIGACNNAPTTENAFCGIFDGQGNNISGLYGVKNNAYGFGLFEGTAGTAVVKNIAVTNSYYQAKGYVGGIAGVQKGEKIENVFTDVIIHITDTAATGGGGGIVGAFAVGTIEKCESDSAITSTSIGRYMGGIAGIANGGTSISNCRFGGSIHCGHTGNAYVGGLVGVDQRALSISNSFVTASKVYSSDVTCTGTVVGANGDVKTQSHALTLTNVYAIKGIDGVSKTIGRTTIGTTTVSGSVTELNSLIGYSAYMNTKLDFDNTWVLIENSVPRLETFAPEEGRIDREGWFEEATGTQEDPYVIDTVAELYDFASRVNAGNTFEGQYIVLDADLTLNTDTDYAKEGYAPEYVWKPIGGYNRVFKGNFDGQMHTISGLYATASAGTGRTTWYVGLFGYAIGATIENVRVEDSYFYAANYSGSAVGALEDGTVSGVYSNSTLAGGDHVGGIVGYFGATAADKACYVKNSWFDGSVTGASYIGGIVDFSTGSGTNYIQHCLFTGTATSSKNEVGGVIGRATVPTIIEDTLSAGKVILTSANSRKGVVLGWLESGSITMTSVCWYVDSALSNGATAVNGGKKTTDLSVTGGTKITDLNALYDTEAYDRLSSEFWTARVGMVPVPSVFVSGDYANIATQGSAYVVDTNLAGNGTAEDPYKISTAAELYGFAILSQTDNFADKYVELTADIAVNPTTIKTNDANAVYYDWYPVGSKSVPFAGTFVGNGHTISGLYKVWDSFDYYIGLFAETASTSYVKDLYIVNTRFQYDIIKDATRIGSVAGRGYGTFDSIYSNASLSSGGYGTGGIVGMTDNGGTSTVITNCWFDGEITPMVAEREASTFAGGIVGYSAGGTLTIKHSLFTGKVETIGRRIGGLIGSIHNASAVPSNVIFTDNLVAGTLIGAGDEMGIIAGRVFSDDESATNTVTISSTFGVCDTLSYDIQKISGGATITGAAYTSLSTDRFIGFMGENATLDFAGTTKVSGEGFTGWVLMETGTPMLKSFVDAGKVSCGTINTEITSVDDIKAIVDSTNAYGFSGPEHKGTGKYLFTSATGKTASDFANYCATLTGFNKVSSNEVENVLNAVYQSGDYVLNVTFVKNTIYATFSTTQNLSEHLNNADGSSAVVSYAQKSNYAADAYTATAGEIPAATFHMVEQNYYSAACYVIQLTNGHFIIIDGGMPKAGGVEQAPFLIEYIESLVPEGKKPVVEAWIASHAHEDHIGVFETMYGDPAANYENRIYVEGFYFNEPNDYITTTYDDAHHRHIAQIKLMSRLFETSTGETPAFYDMLTGQGFTFDGVVMDIMLSQELIKTSDYNGTSADTGGSYNETSTWTMFTINGKKLLTAGDAAERAKAKIVDMYSTSYLTVDVFTALHHGKNINRQNNSGNDSFSKALTVNAVVLFPFQVTLTQSSDQVGYLVVNRVNNFLNKMTNLGISTTYANGSKGTAKYFYYGQGTSVLTFGDTITATILPNNDWDLTK